jgi:hypothetical protein
MKSGWREVVAAFNSCRMSKDLDPSGDEIETSLPDSSISRHSLRHSGMAA